MTTVLKYRNIRSSEYPYIHIVFLGSNNLGEVRMGTYVAWHSVLTAAVAVMTVACVVIHIFIWTWSYIQANIYRYIYRRRLERQLLRQFHLAGLQQVHLASLHQLDIILLILIN